MGQKPREWTEAEIELAKTLPVISVKAIIRTFNCGDKTAKRLQALCGAAPLPSQGFRMPARQLTEEECAHVREAYLAGGFAEVKKQFHCNTDKARRLIIASGARIGDRARKKAPAKMAAGAMLGYVAAASGNADSMEAAAAKKLMRRGYIPVCRARTVNPKAPPDEWIVGSRRLTTNQMQELAGQ